MTIATVLDQEGYQRPHPLNVGAVNNRATLARPDHQTGSGENAEMDGERVLLTSDRFGDSARRKP